MVEDILKIVLPIFRKLGWIALGGIGFCVNEMSKYHTIYFVKLLSFLFALFVD